jgi:hypothetical protein
MADCFGGVPPKYFWRLKIFVVKLAHGPTTRKPSDSQLKPLASLASNRRSPGIFRPLLFLLPHQNPEAPSENGKGPAPSGFGSEANTGHISFAGVQRFAEGSD